MTFRFEMGFEMGFAAARFRIGCGTRPKDKAVWIASDPNGLKYESHHKQRTRQWKC